MKKDELAYKVYRSIFREAPEAVRICAKVSVKNGKEWGTKTVCIKVADILNLIKKQL